MFTNGSGTWDNNGIADYRLSGEATWPAQLHDAKAAVRWLRHRADELGIDPDRIGAWGESAGGHLAALLGVTGTLDADAPLEGTVGVTGVASAVATVVAWYAPTDLVGLPGDLGADPAGVPVVVEEPAVAVCVSTVPAASAAPARAGTVIVTLAARRRSDTR